MNAWRAVLVCLGASAAAGLVEALGLLCALIFSIAKRSRHSCPRQRKSHRFVTKKRPRRRPAAIITRNVRLAADMAKSAPWRTHATWGLNRGQAGILAQIDFNRTFRVIFALVAPKPMFLARAEQASPGSHRSAENCNGKYPYRRKTPKACRVAKDNTRFA